MNCTDTMSKNVPNDPGLWKSCLAKADKKYAVHPSAYSNGWASKEYKRLGGTWRKQSQKEFTEFTGHVYDTPDFSENHGGLSAWFDEDDPKGDWRRISSDGTIGPKGSCGKMKAHGVKTRCLNYDRAISMTKKDRAKSTARKISSERKYGKYGKQHGSPDSVSVK